MSPCYLFFAVLALKCKHLDVVEMRRARFVLVALIAFVSLYFLIPYDWFGPIPRGIKYFYDHERPAIFVQQCQFIEVPIEGDEAASHSEHFRLRGIFAIFRHGER
jgi:hypothetical protein